MINIFGMNLINIGCTVKKNWEMICLQQFYNIFTTNLKWQVVIGCYCWVKKVISVLNSNLNQ